MTWDPLSRGAVELLARGHNLYGVGYFDAGVPDAPEQLRERADRLIRINGEEMGVAAPANRRMAAGLRRSAAADSELAAALAAAHTDHAMGWHGTRRVLDDARSDSMPAADTPLGRQEALARMAARLRQQQHYLHRSHRNSHLLARRLRRPAHLRLRHTSDHPAARVAALPLGAVRYEKAFTPGHVRQRIAAALDQLGITDPVARRNWIRGYETLIARESGGRPSVVGSQPAATPGAVQPDGRGLGFARGIAQTIPATFARYHQPGTSTNIYDPVANICASMNYVIDRYGVSRNGENLAAMVQQADAHRPPKGY
ncbi:MAG: transglycosylase SLT domain-containing protein [Mycobacterium sp.]|uniref:transglycosylase SLT domain-containing protein n=1 Tax=Mycobacterium sp. TaxID=1785 RepID=UPI003BB0A8F2